LIGHIKLIDFGIAKAIDGAHTTNIQRDNIIGTINYMAPETLKSKYGRV
jgi:serine/threonine-protein kinase TTK/MPS1